MKLIGLRHTLAIAGIAATTIVARPAAAGEALFRVDRKGTPTIVVNADIARLDAAELKAAPVVAAPAAASTAFSRRSRWARAAG